MENKERQALIDKVIGIVKAGAYLSGIGIGFEDNCIKNEIEDLLDFEGEFKKWKNSDNVVFMRGKYYTQCSQYSFGMTHEELKDYCMKEYFQELNKKINDR